MTNCLPLGPCMGLSVAFEIWYELPLGHVQYIDGLVQERRNSSANALELHLSCTNPSTLWLAPQSIFNLADHKIGQAI